MQPLARGFALPLKSMTAACLRVLGMGEPSNLIREVKVNIGGASLRPELAVLEQGGVIFLIGKDGGLKSWFQILPGHCLQRPSQ